MFYCIFIPDKRRTNSQFRGEFSQDFSKPLTTGSGWQTRQHEPVAASFLIA